MSHGRDFSSLELVGIALMNALSSKKPMTTTIVYPSEQSATVAFARLKCVLSVWTTDSDTSLSVSGEVLTVRNAAASDVELENVAERPED